MEFPGQLELQHRIRRACLDEDGRPLVFILGSGASSGAVPTTSGMLDYFERAIGTDAEDLADFKEEVREIDAPLRYQAAARFLIERAGLTPLNRAVRLAVLRARTPSLRPELAREYLNDDARLKDLEEDYAGWAIPQGLAAIARVLSRIPVEARGPILTTNFDPLMEIALRANGIDSYHIVADGDGSFVYPESRSALLPVAHLHGFWRQSDTLHTAAQLERKRPRLIASLRQILTNSTCVVLGYGGWDDVLTASIMQLVNEGSERLLDVLWGSHGSEPELGTLTGKELPGRIQSYVNVDINSLMPAVDGALVERSQARRTGSVARRGRPRVNGCTLIDDEFRNLQMARDESPSRTLAFFDGRAPSWRDIFGRVSAQLERSRDILGEVTEPNSADSAGYLIEGPTGEGKSTVLKQVASSLVDETNYEVWWANTGDRIDYEALLSTSVTSKRRVLFVDDADLHIRQIAPLLDGISATGRTDIRVVMAARDTDWTRSTSRQPIPNSRYASRVVKGISRADAVSLVECWSQWGPRGLARLANVLGSNEERASYLYEQSLGAGESALLGAMLTTRYGAEFREHIRELLARLERVVLPGGKTLLDAYLTVCAVHQLGMGSTAIEHLAWSLGLSEAETGSLVVNRLGFEAAAQRHGDYIAPRHPKIAEVATELAEAFARPIEKVVYEFVRAVTAGSRGSRWGDETISVVFAGQRLVDEKMALAAFDGAVAGDALQLRLRNAHIATARRFGRLDLATIGCDRAWDDFDDFSDLRLATRQFFREWSRVVGQQDDYAASAALNACALLDLPEVDRNDRNNAGRALSGLAISLIHLPASVHVGRVEFAGVCAEEAMDVAKDDETRQQAERTLGKAVYEGYKTVDSPDQRRRALRGAVKLALKIGKIGPSRQYLSRADELNDLFPLLGI